MRVNMDSSVATGVRFKILTQKLGVPRAQVFGACYLLWLECYERRSERLTSAEADASAELSGFAAALVEVGLAHRIDDTDEVVIHGVEDRIRFLEKQAERGAKGGKKRAEQANAKQTASAGFRTAQAYSPTPSPALPPTPSQAENPRFDFEAVYAHYPRKQGKAAGLQKAKKRIRTEEDYQTLLSATKRMATLWHGHDLTYCPHWSTFVSQERWRDDQLPAPANGHERVARGTDAPDSLPPGVKRW